MQRPKGMPTTLLHSQARVYRPVASLRFWTSRMHAMMPHSLARRASSAAARACSASKAVERRLSAWPKVLEDCALRAQGRECWSMLFAICRTMQSVPPCASLRIQPVLLFSDSLIPSASARRNSLQMAGCGVWPSGRVAGCRRAGSSMETGCLRPPPGRHPGLSWQHP